MRNLLISLIITSAYLAAAAPGQAPDADVPGSDAPDRAAIAAAVARGVEVILDVQEQRAEWPYEGVYRVRGQIPVGYRVGGTAIATMALLAAPGYAEDTARHAAVARAVAFIAASIDEPLMAHHVEATYDVRGWGYAYGLQCLLALEGGGHTPADQVDAVRAAILFFVDGIEATAIPESGGWNYARRGGFDRPGPSAPFMTGPTLQALYAARAAGYDVDAAVVEAGLQALDRARTPTSAFDYSAPRRSTKRDAIPGSTGRMLSGEAALFLADRSDTTRLRGAVDAFLAHWKWLDARREQRGTHEGPYGVAPYYFYFAHFYAAQAIELLPAYERREYRRRLRALLFSVQHDDGAWNDRVFQRSRNYGTSMALLALTAPDQPAPARWSAVNRPQP